jgi:hypothetical protein
MERAAPMRGPAMGSRAELAVLVRSCCCASEVLLTTSRYRSCGAVAGGAFAGCRRGGFTVVVRAVVVCVFGWRVVELRWSTCSKQPGRRWAYA